MLFNYKEINEISDMIKVFQEEYWKHRNVTKNLYDLNNCLPFELLDQIILRLSAIAKLNISKVCFLELQSDIDFIQEYYEQKRWSSVNRWLSNTNATLRDTFFDYKDKNISSISSNTQ